MGDFTIDNRFYRDRTAAATEVGRRPVEFAPAFRQQPERRLEAKLAQPGWLGRSHHPTLCEHPTRGPQGSPRRPPRLRWSSSNSTARGRGSQSQRARNRKFADSLLEGNGFELPLGPTGCASHQKFARLPAGGRWIRTSGSARDRGLVSRFRFAPELMATNGSRR